jgi:hypothetical protein
VFGFSQRCGRWRTSAQRALGKAIVEPFGDQAGVKAASMRIFPVGDRRNDLWITSSAAGDETLALTSGYFLGEFVDDGAVGGTETIELPLLGRVGRRHSCFQPKLYRFTPGGFTGHSSSSLGDLPSVVHP